MAEETPPVEAWALDALEAGERRTAESAMAADAVLLDAAEQMRDVAGQIGWSAPQRTPPRSLRRRVLTAFELDRAAALPAVLPRPVRRRWTWAWAGALAACFVLLAGLVSWNLRLQDNLAHQAVVLEVTQLDRLMDGRMQVRNLSAGPAAPECEGTLLGSDASAMAYLTLTRLPYLPRERTYQVWVTDVDGQRTSAGTVRPDGAGWGTIWIKTPGGLGGISRVGITEEPAMGSDAPTGPRVASLQIR